MLRRPDRSTGQRQGTKPIKAWVRPTRAAQQDHRSPGTVRGPRSRRRPPWPWRSGELALFGEEQLGVGIPAGGVLPPVPLRISSGGCCWWGDELFTGGGQPLGQRRDPVAGAQLPGDVPDVGVGEAQAVSQLAGAGGPGTGVGLVGVPQLLDPLGGGGRAGAQLTQLRRYDVRLGAELPGQPECVLPLASAGLAGPVGRSTSAATSSAATGRPVTAARWWPPSAKCARKPASCPAEGRLWLAGSPSAPRPCSLACWARRVCSHWRAPALGRP
jgi:hypothetical protein